MNVCFEGVNNSCPKVIRPLVIDVAMTIIMFDTIILTVFGNLLVIISVSHFKQLHTPTNFLVLSLAFADSLLGLVVMPYSMLRSISSCWYFGELFCKLHSCIDMTLCTASIFHLFFISVDRYYAIRHPLLYHKLVTNLVIEVCLLISWTIPGIYSFGLVLSSTNMEGLQGVLPSAICLGSCSLLFNKMWSIISALVSCFIPGSLMIGLYIYIFSVANKQAKVMEIHSKNKSKKTNIKNKISIQSESKAARTLSLVMGAFLLSWMPFFIIMIIDPYLNFSISFDIYNVVLWLGYFNSALNPVIYGLFYPWFKKSFTVILSGKIFCTDSSSINVLTKL
ncbi:trace amine-associated receptor 4-like [Hyperolius riggenbachi]|uniref:trace amine-associated receptor 4-like n=1 Tax=Hyperolius riggenbachi TaxID=752182 RepID=UPI0035A3C29C